jgi:D-amino-acid oxidase
MAKTIEAKAEILVLGGGIIGLTTATVLQSLGFYVALLTRDIPHQDRLDFMPPTVATNFAMASAYPHNLQIDGLEEVNRVSQHIFAALQPNTKSGVSFYRIFEVFEDEPAAAALSQMRMNFRTFNGTPEDLRATVNPPARPGADYLWGWTFESFFADMPIYLHYLRTRFVEKGGIIQTGLEADAVLQSERGRVIVNCLGLGARTMFDDQAPTVIIRGQQVIVPNVQSILDSDGMPLAYNYTPKAEIFSRADGKPEYVHCFPRSSDWVLGQTREPGEIDSDGVWHGEAVNAESLLIGGQLVPAPIVELNELLLNAWVNRSIPKKQLYAQHGYRYYRDPTNEGVRMTSENWNDNLIVHNYGHAGSGVTMSWGCAVRCAKKLIEDSGLKPKFPVGDSIDAAVLSSINDPCHLP